MSAAVFELFPLPGHGRDSRERHTEEVVYDAHRRRSRLLLVLRERHTRNIRLPAGSETPKGAAFH